MSGGGEGISADAAITTERLVLDPVSVADARAALEGRRDPTWADDYPTDGDLVTARLIAEGPERTVGAYARYKVMLRVSGRVIGGCGYKGPPDAAGAVEIGYGLAVSARGQGFATEAVRALIEQAWGNPAVRIVFASTDRGNTASQRVLIRAGFDRVDTGGDQLRWEMQRR